ncbi:MAG: GNAT family N-acetyltransferase [Sphaerobacter sp.]|nr:GNAT family N-acetyltransferase [Sphaerobacter sp.]
MTGSREAERPENRRGVAPIVPLVSGESHRLRLGWSSRFEVRDLEEHLRANPGLTLWIPETGEYVIGGPWRHRREVVLVVELSAGRHELPLLEALVAAATEQGKALVLMSEHIEVRRRAFYAAAEFELLEEILVYELAPVPRRVPDLGDLWFQRVLPEDRAVRDELLALDHAAFPWLWWNSEEEFENYLASDGVEVYLGRDASGAAVSYVGVTRFRGGRWGHLDRIAVAPERQGQGLGWRSLDFAVAVLSQQGARRIGLSTQERNAVSRRLYERYGFRRTMGHDYRLWGRWLGPRQPM